MKHLLLFTLVFFLINRSAESQENCKLKKDKEGIKVYTCDDGDSKFKSLRAEFLLQNVTPYQLKSFLLDGDNYLMWQYNMIESKVLHQVNDHEVIVRSVIDAPWPVTNREMIVNLKVAEDSVRRELQVNANAIAHDYPLSDELVRVPYSQARWEVTTVNDNDLSIRYFLRINPGGSVPTWLVNMAMAEGPYVTFKNLKEKLVK